MTFNQDRISVIIVTCNSLPLLKDCLVSLKRAVEGLTCQLIVVDNNSADGSESVAPEVFADAVVVRNDRNVGFAAACNQGAERARGDYLLFLNPDVQVDPEAVRRLTAACTERGDAGAVTGRLRFPSGKFQAGCRNFPTVGRLLFSRGSFLTHLLPWGRSYTLGDFEETTAVPAVGGTMLLIRRDRFLRAGGFDERFFMYMEDTDLCYRLCQAGYANYFVPGAGAVHVWGRGSRAGRMLRNRLHHQSIWKYFRKHRAGTWSLWLLPPVLFVNFALTTLFPFTSPRKG